MQSRTDVGEESRSVRILLTNLGVAGILYSFRLLRERKAVRDIPELS